MQHLQKSSQRESEQSSDSSSNAVIHGGKKVSSNSLLHFFSLNFLVLMATFVSYASSSEEECLKRYETENKIFVEGVSHFRNGGHTRQFNGTLEQQMCIVYYLWQKEMTDSYADFPEEEGICWNVWGQWSPIRKETFMNLCTGHMAF